MMTGATNSTRVFWVDASKVPSKTVELKLREWKRAVTVYNTKLLARVKDGGWRCLLCNETMGKGLRYYSDEARERVKVHFKLAHKLTRDGLGWQ